jgi:hypothetical protein
MADGGLTVNIDETLAARIRAAAEAAGVSPDALVSEMVARQLFSDADYDWDDDRDPAIDYQIAEAAARDGDLTPVGEVVSWMRSWFPSDEGHRADDTAP